jgi:hypothetical protein
MNQGIFTVTKWQNVDITSESVEYNYREIPQCRRSYILGAPLPNRSPRPRPAKPILIPLMSPDALTSEGRDG